MAKAIKGEVFTPEYLIEEMFDGNYSNNTYFDLCAGHGAFGKHYKLHNPDAKIISVELQEKNLEYLEYSDEVYHQDAIEFIEGYNGTIEDVVFNPPYNNIDLRIILKLIETGTRRITVVHPSSWLIQNKSNVIKIVRDLRLKTLNHIKSVKLWNGNADFNTGMTKAISITVIDMDYNGPIAVDFMETEEFVVDSYEDITVHGSAWMRYGLKYILNQAYDMESIYDIPEYDKDLAKREGVGYGQ